MKPTKNKKPTIVFTMGDPNGVGPEICVRALKSRKVKSMCNPIIAGSVAVLEEACELLNITHKFVECSESDLADWNFRNGIPVLGSSFFKGKVKPGKINKVAGKASIDWVKLAVEMIVNKNAEAMVTAPICKESIEKTIPGFSGHTEFIGAMRGDAEPVLSLVHGKWTIAHVSTHVSLKNAVKLVKAPRVEKTVKLLNELLQNLHGMKQPKIGLAALNPHAGENGLFGDEEKMVLNPVAKALRKKGIKISDALPADVVFPQMRAGTFDGVVAMYHDQGHVVTKTIGFHLGKKRKLNGVNATLGLDVIRTSVDHGTGFDIAWKGVADDGSLIDALEVAVAMAKGRRRKK